MQQTQKEKEAAYQAACQNTIAWETIIMALFCFLAPYGGLWLWSAETSFANTSHLSLTLFVIVIGVIWLFVTTNGLITMDDQLWIPVQIGDRSWNWSTLVIWLSFICLPLVGTWLQPTRPLQWLMIVYLVTGLVNLLIKVNRQLAFRHWLDAVLQSPEEAQVISFLHEIKQPGVYALNIWPWWVIRIQTERRRYRIQVCEPKAHCLVSAIQSICYDDAHPKVERSVQRLEAKLQDLQALA